MYWTELAALCRIKWWEQTFLLYSQSFRENTQSFPVMYTFSCRFLRYSTKLTKFPSIPIYLKSFIMNRCSIMSRAFSSSIDIIVWFFFISRLIWWIALIYFQTSNLPCISRINLMCSWYIIVLSVLLNCIWWYFLTDFYTYIHEYCSFHFFVSFLSTIFGYQSNMSFNKMNLDFSCLFYFLEEFV